MSVFNTSMKILRSKLPILLIYVVVIVMVSILMMAAMGSQENVSDTFEQKGCAITVINRDLGGKLSEGLEEFLFRTNQKVSIDDDKEKLQDALYYENTAYILLIPEGFSEAFLAGEEVFLSKTTLPDSIESYYVDMQIDQYLNAVRLYMQAGIKNTEEILEFVSADLDSSANAEIIVSENPNSDDSQLHIFYFNYLSYSMLALMILGISTILISFHQKDLYRRNLCAPIKLIRMNGELILGISVFAGACYFILIGCGLALHWEKLWDFKLLSLLCLNFLVFSIVCVGIGFLTGVFVRSYNVQSAVANVVTLSMSFLCGVFVPQSIMSASVLKFSQFLPAYWYVKANHLIGSLSDISLEQLKAILGCLGIELLFAAALFAAALAISKKKRFMDCL